jgi:hypothetical protein
MFVGSTRHEGSPARRRQLMGLDEGVVGRSLGREKSRSYRIARGCTGALKGRNDVFGPIAQP